jgi:hypothetical protein
VTKVKIPYYLVVLAAGFLYAVVKNFVPSLPLTEEQVLWAVIAILALLNVDVVTALRKVGSLR